MTDSKREPGQLAYETWASDAGDPRDWHSVAEGDRATWRVVEAAIREDAVARRDYPRKAIEVKVTANGFTWDETLKALRERAMVSWRFCYPKTAQEADKEAGKVCATESYTAGDMCEVYTDGYRTGYLAALNAVHAESAVACDALATAMGLPGDHPQRENLSWLAGRAAALTKQPSKRSKRRG